MYVATRRYLELMDTWDPGSYIIYVYMYYREFTPTVSIYVLYQWLFFHCLENLKG